MDSFLWMGFTSGFWASFGAISVWKKLWAAYLVGLEVVLLMLGVYLVAAIDAGFELGLGPA